MYRKLKAHINNIALPHAIFSMPFAFMGALMATDGKVSAWTLFLIALTVTLARSAALAINNLVDLKYDKLQPRMSYRAMVRGDISKTEAVIFIIACLILLVVTVAQFPPICLKLLPLAALPFIIYPFTKRFTGFCHLVLGIALAMAPAGAWIASGGELFALPMILLAVAIMFWIAGFDAIYGAQDEKFDKRQKLHSLATEFGVSGAFIITKIWHLISILSLLALGVILNLGELYFVGVGVAAGTLIYQHIIVAPYDFSAVTQKYFLRNGVVSIALLIFTWLDYIF